jgi:hypothetical protein
MEDKMKTLFVSLVALVFVLVVGCQSSITDPVVTDKSNQASVYTENFASKDWISSLPGEIDLGGVIQVPSASIDQFADMEGKVRYSIEKVYFDSPPPSPQFAYKVSLYINATITCKTYISENVWIVKNTSQDYVYTSTSNETVKFLIKSFTVKNACPAPLDLVLKFAVDEKVLTLVSKTLKISDGWATIGDPES